MCAATAPAGRAPHGRSPSRRSTSLFGAPSPGGGRCSSKAFGSRASRVSCEFGWFRGFGVSWGIRGVAGSRAEERLWRCRGVGGAHGGGVGGGLRHGRV